MKKKAVKIPATCTGIGWTGGIGRVFVALRENRK